MDTRKKYKLYWRQFSGYKGKKLGFKNESGRWEYGDFTLYKFGYEEVGKNRVEMNALFETKDRWVDLWENIDTVYAIEFFVTKEEILELEKQVLSNMGKRDFWMEEYPSGITEFRLKTVERENKARILFAELFQYANMYNKR